MNKLIAIALSFLVACAPSSAVTKRGLGGIPGGGFIPPTKSGSGGAGDITQVNVTGPITGGGPSGVVTVGLGVCSADQIYKMDGTGTAWACDSDDVGSGVSDGDKGDITVSGSGSSWAIDAAAVTLAKMADIATARIIGRTTAGTGVPEALTGTQATAMLDTVTSGAKGLAPASGGGSTNFLRADGTWAVPAGGGDIDGVTAGDGLTGGGASGTVTLDVVCSVGLTCVADAVAISNRDFGDITASSAGSTWTIDNSTVTSAKLNITTTSCTNQLVSAIGAGGTGTCSSVGSATITDGTVALADMANLAADTIVGRANGAGTGVPQALTGTQVNVILPAASATVKGLVPTPPNNTTTFLRGDATWATVSGGITNSAGNNVVTKSNGTNLVASTITDNGTTVNITASAADVDGTLNADGAATLNANVDLGDSSTDVIQIDGYVGIGTAASSLAGLWVSGAGRTYSLLANGGPFRFDTDGVVTGTFNGQGAATFDGAVDLGNAAADLIELNGELRVTNDQGKLSTKSGGAITLTNCGTGATFVGDRTAGHVTIGTSPGSCEVDWTTAFANNPTCLLTTRTSTKTYSYTADTSKIVITSPVASAVYDWICGDHF